MKRRSIDLNADVGEGCGTDADLMPLVSSVNIACGAHAGDEATMRQALALALKYGTAIGAHPGFADRENFGRKELSIVPAAAAGLVIGQVRMLQEIAAGLGAEVRHVKLHGALYNIAARDETLARAIVAALAADARESGHRWILVALAGSVLAAVGRDQGLRVVGEAFADRTYRRDGSLTPRSEPGAVIADEDAAVRQALRIATNGTVQSADGADIEVDAETLCLHGDGPSAVAFARRIRREFSEAGITVTQMIKLSQTRTKSFS
jgi:5-oxoprolinase (ATP-hydrolysing) subunit A